MYQLPKGIPLQSCFKGYVIPHTVRGTAPEVSNTSQQSYKFALFNRLMLIVLRRNAVQFLLLSNLLKEK